MATTDFGYSNKTASSTRVVSTYDLDILEDYALVKDEPTEVVLSNTTAPIDQEELLSYRCKPINKVNTALNVQYPAPVQAGVQYQVQTESILTTVLDTGVRVDDPIIVQITVRHPRSGNITSNHVQQAVERTVSAAMKDDGTYRWDDLMRSALKPTVD